MPFGCWTRSITTHVLKISWQDKIANNNSMRRRSTQHQDRNNNEVDMDRIYYFEGHHKSHETCHIMEPAVEGKPRSENRKYSIWYDEGRKHTEEDEKCNHKISALEKDDLWLWLEMPERTRTPVET